ncbi:MAG: AsmA family protein [Alphaproteobacteria bacterium]
MPRKVLIFIGITLVAVIGLGVAAWLVWRSDIPRTLLAEAASERLGRSVTIGGLDGSIGWDPYFTLTDIAIAGIDSDEGREFLTIESLELQLDGSELLKLQVAFHVIRVIKADLNLRRLEDGTTNWDFAGADDSEETTERDEFPVIHALIIADSHIRVVDDANDASFDFQVDVASGQAETGARGIKLTGEGSIKDRSLTVQFTGDSVPTLQDEDVPYHLTASVAAGDTSLEADVTLTAGFKSWDTIAGIHLKGPDLAQLFPITGISLPNTPPYELKGRLALTDKLLRFTALQGQVGDSDVAGDVDINLRGERPVVVADLASDRLDVVDLRAIIGAGPETAEGETTSGTQAQAANGRAASERVIPDVPIDLSRMRAIDAMLQYRAGRVQTESLPIDDLSVALSLREGVLELQPLKFGMGSGTLEADITVDASDEPVATKVSMEVTRLPLAKVLQTFADDLGDAEDAVGVMGGILSLQATGNSMHRALAGADGELRVAMSEGRIGALLVEIAGLDIVEALAVAVTGEETAETVPVRCVIMDFDIVDGVMKARTLAVDTEDTLILGKGEIDLETETLALSLEPHPRDASAATVRSTWLVEGTFRNPTVQPDKSDIAAQVGIAAALGVLLTPVAALLPFLDPGDDQPSPCRHLGEDSGAGAR